MKISRINAWIMWAVTSTFYAYQYILRVIPNIMMQDIMQQYAINAATFGQFSGIYYIGYSLLHIPVGLMLDRYGLRRVLPACMALTVIGLLPILFTDLWIYPIIGRFFIGVGSSAGILGAFKVIRLAFPENQFTRILSFAVTIGLLGAIYGGGPVAYLCTIMHYKSVILLLASVGIVLAGITYAVMPGTIEAPKGSMFAHIKAVISSPKMIGVCLFAGLFVGPLEGFADVWATTFLKVVYGIGNVLGASLPSAIYLGMCFGGPVLSFIADKTGSYLGTIAAAGLVMMASFVALLMGITSNASMTVVFVAVGICCAYQIIAIYKASTYVRNEAAGLATAVANMIIMLFGYVFHAIIGVLVDNAGGPSSASALIHGLSAIPIALGIGIAGFVGIAVHDRMCKSTRPH